MTDNEREYFWKTLTSFTGENIAVEREKLNKTVKFPRKLYRFRKPDCNSLEAMRTNRQFFSSAEYYDDPFDSYCSLDWDRIISIFQNNLENLSFNNPTVAYFNATYGCTNDQIQSLFDSKKPDEWIGEGIAILEILRKNFQKMQRSICFSETDLNEVLWLKYADNHRGFMLEFDVFPEALRIDEKYKPETEQAEVMTYYALYPVYYSEKQYDATEYFINTVVYMALTNLKLIPPQNPNQYPPSFYWQRERINLIKHEYHKYDQEWRILHPYMDKSKPKYHTWKPSGVTIGLRTEKPTRDLIVALAKEAGIPNIYECYINNKNCLDKRIIQDR